MTRTTPPKPRRLPSVGRAWAYIGVAFGASVSVAANIAHSYVPPAGAPATWTPELGAVIGAAIWPLSLLISAEVLARNTWVGRGRFPGLTRAMAVVGVVVVAGVAAVVSYQHMSGLLAHYDETWLTTIIGPLAVDGLMLASTMALLNPKPVQVHAPAPSLAPAPAQAPAPALPTARPAPLVVPEPVAQPLVHALDQADGSAARAVDQALAWVLAQPGPTPGPSQVMAATGVSRSTAKRAIQRAATPDQRPVPVPS